MASLAPTIYRPGVFTTHGFDGVTRYDFNQGMARQGWTEWTFDTESQQQKALRQAQLEQARAAYVASMKSKQAAGDLSGFLPGELPAGRYHLTLTLDGTQRGVAVLQIDVDATSKALLSLVRGPYPLAFSGIDVSSMRADGQASVAFGNPVAFGPVHRPAPTAHNGASFFVSLNGSRVQAGLSFRYENGAVVQSGLLHGAYVPVLQP